MFYLCVLAVIVLEASATCSWKEWMPASQCRWVNKNCLPVTLRVCSCGVGSRCGPITDSMQLDTNATILCNVTARDCPFKYEYSRWTSWSKWNLTGCPAKRYRHKTCLTTPIYLNELQGGESNFTCYMNKSDRDSRYDLCPRADAKQYFDWEFTQLLLFILIVTTALMGLVTFICKRKRLSLLRQQCPNQHNLELLNRPANEAGGSAESDDKRNDRERLVTITECSETDER